MFATFVIVIGVVVSISILCGGTVWYLRSLWKKPHVLWFIVPPMIFAGLFILSLQFENWQWWTLHVITWKLSFTLIIISLILFGFSFLGFLVQKIFRLPKKTVFWCIVGVSLIWIVAARIHGEAIMVRDITISSDKITRPYQFVHISDTHYGSTGERHLRRVVEKIKPLGAEFVVITGDFIDANFVDPQGVKVFDTLEIPVWLITGNHEYYLSEGKIHEVIADSDILLIDDLRVSYAELDIIGVNELKTVDETLDHLGGVDASRLTIVLDHQPKTDEVHRASANDVDIMLSGHTHRGQIWPMGLLISLQFPYLAGRYEIGDMTLYVNQGTGTWGPKMRLGTTNEITRIHLIPEQIVYENLY